MLAGNEDPNSGEFSQNIDPEVLKAFQNVYVKKKYGLMDAATLGAFADTTGQQQKEQAENAYK